MFAVHRLLIFPFKVITARHHYRYHGITVKFSPYPR